MLVIVCNHQGAHINLLPIFGTIQIICFPFLLLHYIFFIVEENCFITLVGQLCVHSVGMINRYWIFERMLL